MHARRLTVWIALAAVLSSSAAHAAPSRVAVPSGVAEVDTARRLDINQIVLRVANDGTHGTDPLYRDGGLFYPKGTQNNLLFYAAPWLVAKVGAEKRGVISQFKSEFGPGAMAGATFTDPQLPQYHVYKVARYRGDPMDTARVFVRDAPGGPGLDPLLHHSWSEYLTGAAPYGAPVRMHRLPNTATPASGDSVDVLGPDVLGDVMLWCVYNDADPGLHDTRGGRTAPLGVEIQQSLFAFDAPGPLGNTVFIRYKILNRGANTLDSLLIGLWADPDLGGAGDDVTASDSALSLSYCYNAHYRDNVYGATPPAIGYVLLRGPGSANAPLGPLALTGPYKVAEESANITESWNVLLGRQLSGAPRLDPDGNPSRFWYHGDPVTGTGWLDPYPQDRRLLLSVGPVTMAPGDTQTVDAAIVIGQGLDNLASVANLKCAAAAVKQLHDAGFPGSTPGLACPTEAVESCPRSVDYWRQQCSGGLSNADLTRLAQCVDQSAMTFGFTSGTEAGQFCELLNGFKGIREDALREHLALLANVCAAKLGLVAPPDSAFLGEGIELWSRSVGARTVRQLATNASPSPCFCADSLELDLGSRPIDDPAVVAAYEALAADLRSVNHGIGVGPTCTENASATPKLVDKAASPSDVTLIWQLGWATGLPMAVYRQEVSAWNRVWSGPTDFDGSVLLYSDRSVIPGRTYTYRLGVSPDGRESFYGEGSVTVPAVPSFALLGVTPNPTSDDALRVALTLAERAPLTIDAFDLAGRRVARHRDDHPPYGLSIIHLGANLEPGIYLVRVQQAAHSASAKAVIVR